MKSLEQLSIKGLRRRHNALAKQPVSSDIVAIVAQINKIEDLIQAKLAPAPPPKPKRGRPRIHRRYSGIATRQPQR